MAQTVATRTPIGVNPWGQTIVRVSFPVEVNPLPEEYRPLVATASTCRVLAGEMGISVGASDGPGRHFTRDYPYTLGVRDVQGTYSYTSTVGVWQSQPPCYRLAVEMAVGDRIAVVTRASGEQDTMTIYEAVAELPPAQPEPEPFGFD